MTQITLSRGISRKNSLQMKEVFCGSPCPDKDSNKKDCGWKTESSVVAASPGRGLRDQLPSMKKSSGSDCPSDERSVATTSTAQSSISREKKRLHARRMHSSAGNLLQNCRSQGILSLHSDDEEDPFVIENNLRRSERLKDRTNRLLEKSSPTPAPARLSRRLIIDNINLKKDLTEDSKDISEGREKGAKLERTKSRKVRRAKSASGDTMMAGLRNGARRAKSSTGEALIGRRKASRLRSSGVDSEQRRNSGTRRGSNDSRTTNDERQENQSGQRRRNSDSKKEYRSRLQEVPVEEHDTEKRRRSMSKGKDSRSRAKQESAVNNEGDETDVRERQNSNTKKKLRSRSKEGSMVSDGNNRRKRRSKSRERRSKSRERKPSSRNLTRSSKDLKGATHVKEVRESHKDSHRISSQGVSRRERASFGKDVQRRGASREKRSSRRNDSEKEKKDLPREASRRSKSSDRETERSVERAARSSKKKQSDSNASGSANKAMADSGENNRSDDPISETSDNNKVDLKGGNESIDSTTDILHEGKLNSGKQDQSNDIDIVLESPVDKRKDVVPDLTVANAAVPEVNNLHVDSVLPPNTPSISGAFEEKRRSSTGNLVIPPIHQLHAVVVGSLHHRDDEANDDGSCLTESDASFNYDTDDEIEVYQFDPTQIDNVNRVKQIPRGRSDYTIQNADGSEMKGKIGDLVNTAKEISMEGDPLWTEKAQPIFNLLDDNPHMGSVNNPSATDGAQAAIPEKEGEKKTKKKKRLFFRRKKGGESDSDDDMGSASYQPDGADEMQSRAIDNSNQGMVGSTADIDLESLGYEDTGMDDDGDRPKGTKSSLRSPNAHSDFETERRGSFASTASSVLRSVRNSFVGAPPFDISFDDINSKNLSSNQSGIRTRWMSGKQKRQLLEDDDNGSFNDSIVF